MSLATASVAVASPVSSVNLVKMASGMGMWGCLATLGGASGGHLGPVLSAADSLQSPLFLP